MKTWTGNIWDLAGWKKVIPTNLQGIMGAGLALQANERYPRLQEQYRAWCQSRGGTKAKLTELFIWGDELILAPTKRRWQNPSPIELVELSYWIIGNWPGEQGIAVPPLGAGLGGLEFDVSKQLAEKHLNSERFLFVSLN